MLLGERLDNGNEKLLQSGLQSATTLKEEHQARGPKERKEVPSSRALA